MSDKEQPVENEEHRGLVDAIQSEVSDEAAPFLDFLARNAKSIILGVVAFIVVIAGYGVYEYTERQAIAESKKALGDIIVNKPLTERESLLKAYLEQAPEELKAAALMELARAQQASGKYEEAAASWGNLAAASNGPVSVIAGMGQAKALSEAGKHDEALGILQSLEGAAGKAFAATLHKDTAQVAEAAGKYDVAVAEYEKLLPEAGEGEKEYLSYKINTLKARSNG